MSTIKDTPYVAHEGWPPPFPPVIPQIKSEIVSTCSDKHYNFEYTIQPKDIQSGRIKVDPYFIADAWKLGQKDNSGVLFHILKTIARFGEKNSAEREIQAIYKSIKRLAELKNVKLD